MENKKLKRWQKMIVKACQQDPVLVGYLRWLLKYA